MRGSSKQRVNAERGILLTQSGRDLPAFHFPTGNGGIVRVISALRERKFSRRVIYLAIDYFLTANIPIILFS